MVEKTLRIILVAVLALVAGARLAHAQANRPGGMVGNRGGSARHAPGVGGAPSLSAPAPRPAPGGMNRPSPAAAGNLGRPGGAINRPNPGGNPNPAARPAPGLNPGNRPGGGGGGGINRPGGGGQPPGGIGGGGGRPGGGPPPGGIGGGGGRPGGGIGDRPPFGGIGDNRPGPGGRPPIGGGGNRPPGGGIGGGDRPGGVNRPPNPGIGGNRPGGGGNRPPGGLVGPRPPIGPNRPNLGDNLGVVNRPGAGGRPNVGNNVGNTVVNRPQVGSNNVINRPTNINNRPTNINNRSTNIVSNINNNFTNLSTTNITNVTNVNRSGRGSGGWGWGGYGGGFRPNPYAAYHRGWVNGFWNANYHSPGWGWGSYGTGALGWGVGIGVAAWGLGSLWTSWGYSSYVNPYYSSAVVIAPQPATVVVQQPIVYDYSRPLDLTSQLPPQPVVDQAVASLDSARGAFYSGNYLQALKLADEALQRTPNDPMLHQFRAIALFALGRYDEAAAPLYAVLSKGPGWDWTTLAGLYPNVDVYTQQLRALESYCTATPGAAAARFVLAALYLTQGNPDQAAVILDQVVAIQPQDRLSAQLLESLRPPPQAEPVQPTAAQAGAPTTPNPPTGGPRPGPGPGLGPVPGPSEPAGATEPALPTSPVPARLVGAWTANPAKDVTITLSLDKGSAFIWKVSDRGQAREFRGPATFDGAVLALTPPDQPPMIGNVKWKDDSHFQFRAIGAPADDPGLTFGR